MAFTQQQLNAAKAAQTTAAHDAAPQIRLVAGPGTGKSFSVGERIAWLINQGVAPNAIFAVSFTRSAAEDLQAGILRYCAAIPTANQINVSTLHALTLRILALGGRLTQYPASPRIIDDWEQRNVFDDELKSSSGYSIKRCRELRIHFEAIWSTGNPPLPFISSPVPAITQNEATVFRNFHSNRTQLYACLLPGEAVRQCVDHINSGLLDPRTLLDIEHLIVDEYQDLNNCDVEFVDILARSGVIIFVSGDDDQSIYSFRYAYPVGIQTFTTRHITAGQHALQLCFRCTPSVLTAASTLLTNNSPPTRIHKALHSAYSESAPPVQGSATCLSFHSDDTEAQAIAQSVNALIHGGLPPEDILILLSNRHAQLDKLQAAMGNEGVQLNIQQNIGLASDSPTRFVYSMLRTLHNPNDYLAFRTLLGLRRGIGIRTCVSIADKVLANSLNYRNQFGPGQTAAAFIARETEALNGVISIINAMAGWTMADILGQRSGDIGTMLGRHLSQNEADEWLEWTAQLPADMTIEELENILSSRSEKDARHILFDIYSRLNQPMPPSLNPAGRVRVMTLHSSKGLEAKVVFIPGLEEELLPGPYRATFPGQVHEAARLLYVGMTRARADCVVSFARRRFVNGRTSVHHPSRFAAHLGVEFQTRNNGLTSDEVASILNNCANL